MSNVEVLAPEVTEETVAVTEVIESETVTIDAPAVAVVEPAASLDEEAKPKKQTSSAGLKFTCDAKALRDALNGAMRAVSSRPTHPILCNLKLSAANGSVRIEGTDLSLWLALSVPADVKVGGEITLPAKLLTDITNKLTNDVTIEENKGQFLVRSGRSKFKISGMDATEFPDLDSVEAGESLTISADEFAIAQKVLYACSSDETKQILTGVHVKIFANRIEAAATDGHRLAVASQAIDLDGVEKEFTIPAKALAEVSRNLAKTTGDIELSSSQSQASFVWDDGQISSRLLEGQYPNYQQLIPRQFTSLVTVDKAAFLASLERAAIVAEQKNNIVTLNLDADNHNMTCSVEAADVGSVEDEVPVQASGNSLKISFNIRYMIDAIKMQKTSEIKIQMNTATSPVVISGAGAEQSLALIMPVQVRV